MARKNLGAYLSSIGKDGNQISYNLKTPSGEPDPLAPYLDQDLKTDPYTNEELLDLDNPTTGLIGDYLRYIQDVFANTQKYLNEPGNFEASNTDRGDPINAAQDSGAEGVFAGTSTTLGTNLSNYSNSKKYPIDEIIDKTSGGAGGKDGHALLSSIKGSSSETGSALDKGGAVAVFPVGTEKVPRETSDILQRFNRFNPGTEGRAFAGRGKTTTQADTDETMIAQSDFGDYKMSASSDGSDAYGYEDLKKIAASVMIKAAGIDTSDTVGSSIDPEDRAALRPSSSAKDLLKSQIATGRKSIPTERLKSQNAFGTPTVSGGESYRSKKGSFLSDDDNDNSINTDSFGTTYTSDFMFDSSNSHLAQEAAAIASLIAVGELGNLLMDDVVGSLASEKEAALGRGPFLSGVFGGKVGPNIVALRNLLLVPTMHDFKDCVDEGVAMLFNNKISSLSSLGKTGDAAKIQNAAGQAITDSPGYWLAMSRGILRSVDEVVEASASTALGKFDSVHDLVKILRKNKLIGFFRYLASIGDISLQASMGMGRDNQDDNFFNVDKLPDGPSTRVGKSRSTTGFTTTSLAWRNNVLPSVFLLPREILKATTDLGTGGFGTNPAKGMLATTLYDKTYMDISQDGPGQRIPGDVVERLENMLDSEYCPFYFHDIRTNEIVAFHAFLSSLSDTFQPNYTNVSGYGRMDDVQIYKNTTRSIGMSFVVAATSQEDFDEMWFKINKLLTMIYPQYSEGTKVASTVDDATFIQPFSQVLKASPLVRLRVGDVVKSNYSKFNLARLFGVGTDATTALAGEDGAGGGGIPGISNAIGKIADALDGFQLDLFMGVYGSPLGLLSKFAPGLEGSQANRMLRAAGSQILVNGFANPILREVIGNRLRDPDIEINPIPNSTTAESLVTSDNGSWTGPGTFGYFKLATVFLKPTDGKSYTYVDSKGNKQQVRFNRPIRGTITGRKTVVLDSSDGSIQATRKMNGSRTIYKVKITDLGAPTKFLFSGHFEVNHSDLIMDPAFMFNIALLPVLSLAGTVDMAAEALTNEAAAASGIPADALDISVSETAQFFSSYANPIVKAFNSSRGRGLAGFIKRFSIKHLDSSTTWETDWNSRAPKFVKIELGFTPIHDIAPGIDSQGFNRAPIYNVGRAMEYVSGDPYDDNGLASKFKFRNDGRLTFKSKKTTDGD